MPEASDIATRLRKYAADRRQQLESEIQQAEAHRAGRKEELDALEAFINSLNATPL